MTPWSKVRGQQRKWTPPVKAAPTPKPKSGKISVGGKGINVSLKTPLKPVRIGGKDYNISLGRRSVKPEINMSTGRTNMSTGRTTAPKTTMQKIVAAGRRGKDSARAAEPNLTWGQRAARVGIAGGILAGAGAVSSLAGVSALTKLAPEAGKIIDYTSPTIKGNVVGSIGQSTLKPYVPGIKNAFTEGRFGNIIQTIFPKGADVTTKTAGSWTYATKTGIEKIGNTVLNTKTENLVVEGLLGAWKHPLAKIVGAGTVIGSIIISLWAKAEAPEGFMRAESESFNWGQKSGDWTRYEETSAVKKAYLEDSNNYNIIDVLPVVGPAINIRKKWDAQKEALAILDALHNDIKASQGGESEGDMWKRLNAEKAAQEKANVDYRTEQFIYGTKESLRLKEEAANEERAARRADMEEQAEFWAKYAEEQRRFEEEERQRIAEFWLAYWKAKLRMQEESGGFSTLKFRYL